MIRRVACSNENLPPKDRIFQIIAFRMFSNIETWKGFAPIYHERQELQILQENAELHLLHINL
jgi:hypothetical protein